MTTMLQGQPKNIIKEALRADRSLFYLPKTGDIVAGVVVGRESGAVYLDLGPYGIGIIYGREYFQAQDILKKIKTGDKLSAKIVDLENDDGYRELSLREAGEEQSWGALKQKQASGEIVEAKIAAANRGGLMTEIEGVIGFLPVSQLSIAHYPRIDGGDKEKILEELRKFVDQTLKVRVIDVSAKEQKLIVSERAAENDTVQSAIQKYKVGDVVDGVITGVVNFGAFIKFDPVVEGLIHISELDWQLIEDPHAVVNVGDNVRAKIVDISAGGRISLSLKALKDDPWKDAGEKFTKGQLVRGEIKRIHSYGALVKLDEQLQGLLHVSEFTDENTMRQALHEGDIKEFEILSLEPAEHRIALRLFGAETQKEQSQAEEKHADSTAPSENETPTETKNENLAETAETENKEKNLSGTKNKEKNPVEIENKEK